MANADDYGAVEWLRSHRVGLGPIYAAVPVLALGVGLRFVALLPALLILSAVVAACAYWVLSARGWRRPYFMIAMGVAVGWISAVRLADSVMDWTWAGAAWACATVALAIPWWADSVRRTQVTMEATIRNWPIRAGRIRLNDTRIVGMKGTNVGWAARLTWLPGAYTVDEVEKRRTEIEGALGLRSGELRMPLDGRSTNSINLVAVTNDPHERPVLWDIPTDEVDGQFVLRRLRARDPLNIGVREDSFRKLLSVYVEGWGARQILIGGVKGSGKSGLLTLLWAYLSLCEDVVQWGVDLKGGMELGPWRGVFDWIVETREGAVRMMQAANAEMERRQAYCKARGWKQWKVDKDHPLLVISIDEAASLLGNARSSELDSVAELSRKGRALGIVFIIATQYPTLEALGSTQVREQIDQRFCFRMSASEGEGYVIPDQRVDAHKIPADRPGTCYHQDGETVDRMPMRILYVEDDAIDQLVSLLTGYTCGLDEAATAAIVSVVPEYAEREIFVPVQRDGETVIETVSGSENETIETLPEWSENDDVSLDALTGGRAETLTETQRDAERDAREDVEPERLPEAAAKEALLSALRGAEEEGVKVSKLMVITTRRSTWVYDRLNELEEESKVARTGTGGWKWTGAKIHAV